MLLIFLVMSFLVIDGLVFIQATVAKLISSRRSLQCTPLHITKHQPRPIATSRYKTILAPSTKLKQKKSGKRSDLCSRRTSFGLTFLSVCLHWMNGKRSTITDSLLNFLIESRPDLVKIRTCFVLVSIFSSFFSLHSPPCITNHHPHQSPHIPPGCNKISSIPQSIPHHPPITIHHPPSITHPQSWPDVTTVDPTQSSPNHVTGADRTSPRTVMVGKGGLRRPSAAAPGSSMQRCVHLPLTGSPPHTQRNLPFHPV